MQTILQVCYVKIHWFTQLVIFTEGAHFCMCGAMALHLWGLPFTLVFITMVPLARLTVWQSNICYIV